MKKSPPFLMPSFVAIASLAMLASLLVSPTPVFSAGDPGATCAASKQKAAAKKFSAKVKCHSTATKKGEAVDAACLTKAEGKFDDAFAKAELKGGCATTSDAAGIEVLIDDCVNELVGALPGAVESSCTNGLDDDGDHLTDCRDSECDANPVCAPESDCSDVVDNDADTFVDCDDPGCQSDPVCEETNCEDGMDNDLDTYADCEDPGCATNLACL